MPLSLVPLTCAHAHTVSDTLADRLFQTSCILSWCKREQCNRGTHVHIFRFGLEPLSLSFASCSFQETEKRYKTELEALGGRVWELEGMVGGRLEERERVYRRKLRAAVAECRSSRVRGHASATSSEAGGRRREEDTGQRRHRAKGHSGVGGVGAPRLQPAGVSGGSLRGSPPPDERRRTLSVTIRSRQGGGSGRVRSNSHA